jgi:hypothetical protein
MNKNRMKGDITYTKIFYRFAICRLRLKCFVLARISGKSKKLSKSNREVIYIILQEKERERKNKTAISNKLFKKQNKLIKNLH